MADGPFEIVEIAAAGAYGTVCIARAREDGRTVALKVLKTGLSDNPKVLARSRDEARMLYRLRHPDIVQVEALIEVAGRPVLVMEWIEGISLDRLLHHHRDGLPFTVVAEIARRTAGALHAAHEGPGPAGLPLRIVHRDIKPGNLILATDGRLKVVDFGVAHADFSDREATTISTVMGSQNYLAPERVEGAPVTPGVDVYALGVTLFELLTGRVLVLAREPDRHEIGLRNQLGYLRPEGLDDKRADRLRDLVGRMCARAVERRPSALEVAASLQAMLERGPAADLAAFAREHVAPLYEARARIPPEAHPEYAEVRFLEDDELPREDTALEPAADDASKAVERADRRVRRFLGREEWHEQVKELRWLLATNPSWSEAPFLEVLAPPPWWAFWRPGPSPQRIAAALEILRHRRSERVIEAARALAHHADPEVARAARELIDAE